MIVFLVQNVPNETSVGVGALMQWIMGMVGCLQLVITKAIWFLWLLLCLCSWFYRRIWLLRLPGASEDLPSSTTAHVHVSISVLTWYSHLYIDIADVFHQKPTVRDLKRMKKMLIYAKSSVKFVYKRRRACKETRKKGSKERKVGLNQTEDETILGSIIVPKDHNSEGDFPPISLTYLAMFVQSRWLFQDHQHKLASWLSRRLLTENILSKIF